MDKPVNCDAAERIEQLYRYAELKAVARQDLSDEIETSHENSSYAPASDVRFVLAAKGELERRALRTRYLPIELSADTGWALLLDLFVSEAQPSSVKAAHCCNRWNLSHSTFARLIAALIEEGLLVRVFDEEHHEALTGLRLTPYGRERVCSVLRHF